MTTAKSTNTARPPGHLLWIIAEDDPDDQLLMTDALAEINVSAADVTFVPDGQELIETLKSGSRLPSLILLDLNMPKMDGREALKEIKSSQALNHIPVIILTTSRNEDDVALTYRNGGNSYFTKPPLFDDLVDTMALIKEYWTQKVILPV